MRRHIEGLPQGPPRLGALMDVRGAWAGQAEEIIAVTAAEHVAARHRHAGLEAARGTSPRRRRAAARGLLTRASKDGGAAARIAGQDPAGSRSSRRSRPDRRRVPARDARPHPAPHRATCGAPARWNRPGPPRAAVPGVPGRPRPPAARGRMTPMPDVRFPVQAASGVPVVTAPEQIGITNAADLRAALLRAAGGRARDVRGRHDPHPVLRLAGLHVLAGAHKRAPAEGGAVLLVIAGAAVLRIFAVTGLDRVIP